MKIWARFLIIIGVCIWLFLTPLEGHGFLFRLIMISFVIVGFWVLFNPIWPFGGK